MKKQLITGALAALTIAGMAQEGGYVTGDFHQHTTYTDGGYTFGHMMEMSNKYGLDWWANSEHGGSDPHWGIATGLDMGTTVKWEDTGIALRGKSNGSNMWRWQSLTEWSFRDVLLYRRVFPDKLIIQGYEMNVPGHEHASMAIIGNQFAEENPDVNALAQFEYLFDAADTDDSQPLQVPLTKNATNNHGKAVAAVKWLQDNYPTESWVIPAHPERFRYPSGQANYEGYNIEHFRDLNNAAPDVFFGFESIPGHQKATNRGEYHSGRGAHGSYGTTTYGGAGLMTAKVGGLWDAMLSEGRRFWVFASSDSHLAGPADGDFYPGEYQKTYTYVDKKNDAQAVANGLRSGNSFVVHGDLIDVLEFTIGTVSMGGEYKTSESEITINIRLRDPQGANFNTYSEYTNPELDHFDLIAGIVTGKVAAPATVPADGITGYSDEYKKDSVETTKVIARFAKNAAATDPNGIATTAWTQESDGFISVSYKTTLVDGEKMYFRLRGTNQGLNVAGETDAAGNPLADVEGENSAAKAFSDLWFYSNPIFVTSLNPTSVENVHGNRSILVYPNPAKNSITVETAEDIESISIFTASGQEVISQKNGKTVDLSATGDGVYILNIKTGDGVYNEQFVVKK